MKLFVSHLQFIGFVQNPNDYNDAIQQLFDEQCTFTLFKKKYSSNLIKKGLETLIEFGIVSDWNTKWIFIAKAEQSLENIRFTPLINKTMVLSSLGLLM